VLRNGIRAHLYAQRKMRARRAPIPPGHRQGRENSKALMGPRRTRPIARNDAEMSAKARASEALAEESMSEIGELPNKAL